MKLQGIVAAVTGGASGLGLATVGALVGKGAKVVIIDLPQSEGAARAASFGDAVAFAPADVSDEAAMTAALAQAARRGPLRALIHCAGRGGPLRVLDRDGAPGSLSQYEAVIRTNLIGSFNALRLAAAHMARLEPVDGERGACVLTASIAAYEGQIGQIPYASSKAGIVGMTLVAARDLAVRGIRVFAIAPGVFDTPILSRFSAEHRAKLADGVPQPKRLGQPDEFAALALHMLENSYLNGETVRLDGALRMTPR